MRLPVTTEILRHSLVHARSRMLPLKGEHGTP